MGKLDGHFRDGSPSHILTPPPQCSASAYLSFFFADCLMSRWLLNYTPSATLVRLLTTNALIAYICSWVIYLSGAAEDKRMLLPAWVSIATVCVCPVPCPATARRLTLPRRSPFSTTSPIAK